MTCVQLDGFPESWHQPPRTARGSGNHATPSRTLDKVSLVSSGGSCGGNLTAVLLPGDQRFWASSHMLRDHLNPLFPGVIFETFNHF